MADHDTQHSDQLAAVDKLAATCTTAIRALDQAVDTALAETLNYLAGAQVELDRLASRIMEAREQLDATRARWQGQRKLADTQPSPSVLPGFDPLAGHKLGQQSVPPPPAFLQTKPGQQSVLGANSGKHDAPRQ